MAGAVEFVFYAYTPSKAAAVIMCIFFITSALFQVWMVIRQKSYYFIPFIVGCLFEAVGYIGRIMSAAEAPDFTMNPYIIQSVLILLGPPLMAASIYMVLGRLIVLLDAAHHSIVRPKWLTAIFVTGDVLSFFIQAGGGGIMSSSKTTSGVKLGENVIVAGLIVQIIWFGVFIAATIVFDTRVRRVPTLPSKSLTTPWQRLIYVLYASSALIMIRSIYRVLEYITGSTGALQENEIYLYVFDALPMALVCILFAVFHPSQVVGPKAMTQIGRYSNLSMEPISHAA